jgi:hypothetical protein
MLIIHTLTVIVEKPRLEGHYANFIGLSLDKERVFRARVQLQGDKARFHHGTNICYPRTSYLRLALHTVKDPISTAIN